MRVRRQELRVIGIDEISYRKRHKYATLVYDLERSVVVWVGQGRGRRPPIEKVFRLVSSVTYQKSQIHIGCCDMSEAYMGGHLESLTLECPIGARPMLHSRQGAQRCSLTDVSQGSSGAKRAPRTEKRSVRGLRSRSAVPAFIHSFARTGTRQTLRALEKHNRRIYRAWRLKDEFEQLWTFNAPWAALRFFKRWTTSADEENGSHATGLMRPLRCSTGSRRHQARSSAATVEGFNCKAKLTLRKSYGSQKAYRAEWSRSPCIDTLGALRRAPDPFADMIYC